MDVCSNSNLRLKRCMQQEQKSLIETAERFDTIECGPAHGVLKPRGCRHKACTHAATTDLRLNPLRGSCSLAQARKTPQDHSERLANGEHFGDVHARPNPALRAATAPQTYAATCRIVPCIQNS